MVDVYIPEKKSAMSKLFGGLQAVGQGAGAFSNIMGAFGGGAETTGISGGAAGGKYGLGLKFGNVTAAESAATADTTAGAATGGSSYGATAAEYAGPAVALGTAAYQTDKNIKEGKAGENMPIGVSGTKRAPAYSNIEQTYKAGRDINNEFNRFTSGLSLTAEKADGLGAMERRMSNQQTAMQDIQAAQEQLNVAGLPTDERRRIGQKLELARQQIGGKNRGNKRLYT
jgi:hypothetical protein